MATQRLATVHTQNSVPAISRKPWVEAAAVAAVMVLGAGLRLFRLGQWSFWPDEIFSFGTRPDGFNNSILLRSLATDLIGLAVRTLGPSEWNARLAPALIGMAAIPLLYLLLRRCLSFPGALFTTLLLAASPWHLYWSQNARFYTLLFLFFNLGLLLFYLGIEEDRPWYLLAALVLFGLAARERLVALLGMPALVVYLLLLVVLRFERPRGLRWRNLAIFFGPALLAGAVLVAPYASNLDAWLRGFGRLNNSPFFLAAGTIYYVGLPLAVFAGGSGLYLAMRRDRLALLMGLSAVLPLLLIMGISLVQYTANRYVFFSLFSWLVLAGLGFAALWRQLAKDSPVWALVVAGALLAAYGGDLFAYYTLQNGNRDDWRAAFAYVAAHGEPGDRVVTTSYDAFAYYLGEPYVYRPWNEEETPQDSGTHTWYIEDMTVAELYPQQRAEMEEHARQQADFDVRLPGRTFRMRVYVTENP